MTPIVTMRWVRRVLLLIAAALALVLGTSHADAADLIVDCDAGDSLQEAIDSAPDDGTVQVVGTCMGPIVIDRSLTLAGPATILGHYETQAAQNPVSVLAGGVQLVDLNVEPVLAPDGHPQRG